METTKMSTHINFHNGGKMPVVGLGTWQATDAEMEAAVDSALEAGYRHIDTATFYENEAAIGRALRRWFDSGKLKREDVFIVTKLPNVGNRAESVEKYIKRSLEALQLKYIDLYLIHHPGGLLEKGDNLTPVDEKGNILIDPHTDHISLWKAMERQVDLGHTKFIGLSNFNARQIKRIVNIARILPANNQIEVHIYFQQKELVAFCRALDITVCAYGPLGSPGLTPFMKKEGLDHSKVPPLTPLLEPLVLKIAKNHNKTSAQILLRHSIQRGIAVIPKSSNPKRIKENINIFDFELTEEEMDDLNSLDKGRRARIFNEQVQQFDAHPEFPYRDAY